MTHAQRIWKPHQSVGGIVFGYAESNLNKHGLIPLPDEEVASVGWAVYGCNDSIRVYCEHGKVVSIAVYDTLIFEGENLIGCSFDKIKMLFPEKTFREDDPVEMSDGMQTPQSCDELGVQFWINSSNLVVSCFCDDGM